MCNQKIERGEVGKKEKQEDLQKHSNFQAPIHVSATAAAEGLGSPLTF